MSADPLIADPSDTQEYSRYSYVTNRPMFYTDPSGFRKRYKDTSLNSEDTAALGRPGLPGLTVAEFYTEEKWAIAAAADAAVAKVAAIAKMVVSTKVTITDLEPINKGDGGDAEVGLTSGVTLQGTTTIDADGHKFIQSYEAADGPDLKIYPDAAGHLTIGYGHRLTKEEIASGKFNKGISNKEALDLYMQDARVVEADIARLIKAPLSQQQFNAVASLLFNVGATKFAKWNVRAELSAGNYSEGVAEFANINKVTDKDTGIKTVNSGLNTRRIAEMKIFRSGIYDNNN